MILHYENNNDTNLLVNCEFNLQSLKKFNMRLFISSDFSLIKLLNRSQFFLARKTVGRLKPQKLHSFQKQNEKTKLTGRATVSLIATVYRLDKLFVL